MRVLIFGCGYVGEFLAEQLARLGHEVAGVRRSPWHPALPIKPLITDITLPESLATLPTDFDWIVNCTAATGGGPENYRRVYVEGNRNVLAWLRDTRACGYVYTSSTAVYGQDDGATVTEADPTEPAAETARILVEAERTVLAHAGCQTTVMRVAGIYGPGRGYWLKQFLAGEARIEGNGERIINMVHRDDVAGAIIRALEYPGPGGACNVVDNEPATQLQIFEWLARRSGRPLPPRVPSGPGSTGRRAVTNKRVDNRKLREELGYRFTYPTFREGYAAELARLGVV